ncbi:hypothetical protein GO988_01295 [Hymenobacter sp. HMF4947]|uniref:Alpha/beta fold hydrolase n=1 Tax=Hymenobacter ginkgonis TaxID=2682976 RepID=A0A7K1T981_9BACT|nr:alpha/beta hydrolase [Hymenobacter ginkgonis]MVN74953.1 hypothetical protein [Hymenobacter ginkgonis]
MKSFTVPHHREAPLIRNSENWAVLQRHNVQVVGRGQPTLIFCNGFNCNQQVWHYLTPALATRYQLVLFDQMGTGRADRAAYDPRSTPPSMAMPRTWWLSAGPWMCGRPLSWAIRRAP